MRAGSPASPATNTVDLSIVVRHMTKSDVSAKLFAIVTTVKTLKVEPATSDFLEIIQHLQIELEGAALTSRALLDACTKLCARLRREETTRAAAAETNEDWQKLQGRIQELTAYLYLSATVIDVFGPSLTEQGLRSRDKNAIHQLVRARQDLRIHPGIAFTRATTLRGSLDLDVIKSCWGAPEPVAAGDLAPGDY